MEIVNISIIANGFQSHYIIDLCNNLAEKGVFVDLVGSDIYKPFRMHKNINFLNIRGSQDENKNIFDKTVRIVGYYFNLIMYALKTKNCIFHIQWFRFVIIEGIFLNTFFKVLGKKIVYTAHNILPHDEEGLLYKVIFNIVYRIADAIIVHTEKVKIELIEAFHVNESKIFIIPHGLNDSVPTTSVTCTQAKEKLGINMNDKTLLFFGNIAPYKGLGELIKVFAELIKVEDDYRLVIAGQVRKRGSYWNGIDDIITKLNLENHIIKRVEFIPDDEIEIYFKAADVLILPYKKIYQSGVIFLAYSFGLPVIASDVGSLREDIVNGETGFIYDIKKPDDFIKKILEYFQSDIYKDLKKYRNKIIDYGREKYSNDKIGLSLRSIYAKMEPIARKDET